MPIRRFPPAFAGLGIALRLPEVRLHVLLALFTVGIGAVLCLERVSWALLLFAIGLVLTTEVLNSSLEHALNALHPRAHPGIRVAKDLAAAAVAVAALTALVIGLVLFIPPFLQGTVGHCVSTLLSGTI